MTLHALKEWSVVIDALATAKTIMLLRKGGIKEQNGKFEVTQTEVLLYPTYEHQQASLLKPDYAKLVQSVISGWHPETVKIHSWAKITHIIPVSDAGMVEKLQPYHIWGANFVCDRLKWKPHQPLYILLLKVYNLPKIHEIPYLTQYGGCKSWIDLESEIYLENSVAVLPESRYGELVAEILDTIK
ncbi:DUF1802 family protein [Calothrix sp. PCC 6303]|uniref:DUF1802 family protein n=1 Tax=Calothrix sp. PCC 6303 TaxID=1170562 RepID=UPI0002A0276E|nr:DUF1802 family protein [Calothrix sp. PCC 6303]AFZ02766.1 protein of unknown function DUF1802 [Calothrix sp. PCC 6303]